jgi:tRNA-Thr(GGU) m(6)t(6)A37 methyltransferase TsaA
MKNSDIKLSPVGTVRAGQAGSTLEIAPEYRAALTGLAGFSHVNVIWWAHFLDQPMYREILVCDQPYRNAPAQLGIFATRSPVRPNPLCVSVASIIAIDEQNGRIDIASIDAEDGTPILDIKPYHPCEDRLRDFTVPQWCANWPQWHEDSEAFDWEAEFVNAR